MKEKLGKILLAVTFLFLVPNLCMSQSLKGIWKLMQGELTSAQASRYKIFEKNGHYYNVDAYVRNAVDIGTDDSSSTSKFCPYKITRSGEYSIIAKGVYCEKLQNEYGRQVREFVPISYRIEGKKMTLLFRLGNTNYQEIYQKVPALGR